MPARETGIVLAFVLAGGGCGTLARSAIDQIWPAQGWPWATFCINLLGTAVLAWLLTWLAGQGPETRLSSRLRQGVGTGLLGGFTTYSAFGVQVAERLPTSPWLATGYALGSLVGGMAAALVAARLTRLAMNRRQAS
ncbi:MAG: CrcB family protein [Micrococcales bacterium]|nr:CrcB family protein [Micrococcales bacterium]